MIGKKDVECHVPGDSLLGSQTQGVYRKGVTGSQQETTPFRCRLSNNRTSLTPRGTHD